MDAELRLRAEKQRLRIGHAPERDRELFGLSAPVDDRLAVARRGDAAVADGDADDIPFAELESPAGVAGFVILELLAVDVFDAPEKRVGIRIHLQSGLPTAHHEAENQTVAGVVEAFDIEFDFGSTLGFQEIEGVHNRSDFDLKQHQEFSSKKLEYVDQVKNTRYLPYVIETSVGADRVTLAVMVNAMREEAVPGEQEGRTVMGFHPALAPIKAGIFPLTKKDGQPEMAERLGAALRKRFTVFYDEAGAIARGDGLL